MFIYQTDLCEKIKGIFSIFNICQTTVVYCLLVYRHPYTTDHGK